jgi:glycosyltransferase involved in cell wall biosynthesis
LTDRPGDFPGVEVVPLPTRGGVDRLRWQYVAVPRAVRRLRPDVFHDTKNALPFLLPCPAAVTVHDLAYHTTPTTFGRFSRAFLKVATADAVRRARAIVVPSQATAADLRRIHVVPHGIDAAQRPDAPTLAAARQRLGLPERFVLHVGTVQARKNVDLVVAGVQDLRRRGFPHRVVVVGRDGWRADAALAALRADATAVRIPHAAPADLAAIYALADAFCSPSAYEGFGFAVADALAAGVPTVVSDVSSLPELCGEAAVRLPRLDAMAVADALAAVLGDEAPPTSPGRQQPTATWARGTPRSLPEPEALDQDSASHGTPAGPVRGLAAGAKPWTAGGSLALPTIGGDPPGATTRVGRRGLP